MIMVVRRRRGTLRVRLAVLAGLALAVAAIALVIGREQKPSAGGQLVPTPPSDGRFASVPDPLAWDPARAADFVTRAARGTTHALYANPWGGVLLRPASTTRWRP